MNQFLSEAGKMLFPLVTGIAMRALKSVLNGVESVLANHS